MIRRVVNWFRSNAEWKRDHLASWPAYTRRVDGATRLMSEAEGLLIDAAVSAGYSIADRLVGGAEDEGYVRFRLAPTNVEIWLYSDAAEISTPSGGRVLEEWDFRTPSEFLDQLISEAIVRAESAGVGT